MGAWDDLARRAREVDGDGDDGDDDGDDDCDDGHGDGKDTMAAAAPGRAGREAMALDARA